jgi:hypothetical protein
METFWTIAFAVVGALFAAGAVVFIKTARRREGTRDPRHTEVVPVKPMSAAHARRLRRRYLITAAAIGGGLVVAAVALA